jgi:hypothetical protein
MGMMKEYTVTIRRVRYTSVIVEALSVSDAKRQVREYGPDLAMSDYPIHSDDMGPATVINARVFKPSSLRR